MRAVIIGAGIIGAATARALARDGVDVTVLERHRAVSGTSSSGEGNLLISDKGPGHELELTRRALDLWPRLDTELRDELGGRFPSIEFERKGGLVVATTPAGAESLLAFSASQRSAGIDARVVDTATALQLEPDLNPGVTASVWYPEDGQVQPVIAAQAFIASARRAGARFIENVARIDPLRGGDGSLIGVIADGVTIGADLVVVAAGPWSGEVSARLGVPLPIRPRRGMVLVTARMPHRIFHKVYDSDYVGAVGSDDARVQTSSVVEATAAGTVLIGSSRQRAGFDRSLQVDVLRELAAKAIRLFPFLAEMSVMRSYGGYRPFMPDHVPVIGPDPRLPGLWHASGHEGAGIGLSVATAEMIADLALGRPPALDPAPFSPGRPSLLESVV